MNSNNEPKPRRVDFMMENSEFDLKANLIRIWKSVPLFVKFISFLTIIFYILNIFINSISFYLSNIPLYTLKYFQIWRIITSVFMTTSILNIIIGLIFWIREASSLETSLGTIKYMLIFLRNSLLIQIFYTIISFLISLIIRNKDFLSMKILTKGANNCGFWPIIMCEMTLLCLSNSDTPVKFLFLPWPFKAKFYPIIWLIIFCLINNFSNIFELIIGIIFAFIYHFWLKNIMSISDYLVEKLENNVCFRWMKNFNGFVSVSYITNKFTKRNNKSNVLEKNNSSGNIILVDKKDDINRSKDDIIERTINVTVKDTNSNEEKIDSSENK